MGEAGKNDLSLLTAQASAETLTGPFHTSTSAALFRGCGGSMAISAHEEDLYFRVLNVSLGLPLASQVRVAGTSSARRRGLMGVNELAEGAGIWIAPCEAIHTFGMKIPIDVIFLDAQLRVRKLLREPQSRSNLNLHEGSFRAGVAQREPSYGPAQKSVIC